MKRFILAIFMAFCSFAAVAQTPCVPTGLQEIRYGRVGNDFYAYWYCKGKYQNSVVWRTFLGAEAKPEMIDQLAAFVQGKNPKLIDTPVQYGPDDPKIAHLKKAVFDAVKADPNRPPEPVWVVAKNGTAVTRPAYFVDYTNPPIRKLSVETPDRARVGALCMCRGDVPLEVGKNTYCPVVNAGYALCVRKQ